MKLKEPWDSIVFGENDFLAVELDHFPIMEGWQQSINYDSKSFGVTHEKGRTIRFNGSTKVDREFYRSFIIHRMGVGIRVIYRTGKFGKNNTEESVEFQPVKKKK